MQWFSSSCAGIRRATSWFCRGSCPGDLSTAVTSQLHFCVLRRIQTVSWWDTQQSRPQGWSSALTSTFEGDLSPLLQETEEDLSQVPADHVPAHLRATPTPGPSVLGLKGGFV